MAPYNTHLCIHMPPLVAAQGGSRNNFLKLNNGWRCGSHFGLCGGRVGARDMFLITWLLSSVHVGQNF